MPTRTTQFSAGTGLYILGSYHHIIGNGYMLTTLAHFLVECFSCGRCLLRIVEVVPTECAVKN